MHYPKLIDEGRIETGYYAHVKDVMATILELTDTQYPSTSRGYPVLSSDSRSLLPNMQGVERYNPETLFLEHEGNRAVRHGKWKLVSYYNEARGFIDGPVGTGRRTGPWELYDMDADRVELHDLSAAHPQLRDKLIEEYGRFSERTGVSDWEAIQRDLEKIYGE
jgi:arylsulfatase